MPLELFKIYPNQVIKDCNDKGLMYDTCVSYCYCAILFTDLPFILSNDTIAVLDPHRVNINIQNKDGSLKTGCGLSLKDFRRHLGSIDCFKGLFNYSPEQDRYPGTIFRFPLRDCHSEISESLFDCDMVNRKLYYSLVEEGPLLLLFLKNISSIGLYRYDIYTGQEKLLYQIRVDQSNVSAVQQGRNKCTQSAENWGRRNDMFCHINSVPIAFENHFMETVPKEGRYNWLVMNCIAGMNCDKLQSLSKKLKVIPWVGIAAQLPSVQISECIKSGNLDVCDAEVANVLAQLSRYKEKIPWKFDEPLSVPGHAFCFLPLPFKTGLPVCIHGYFSVADNRRSIKWPSHDEQGEEAQFNKVLVDDLITPLYAILLACRSTLIEYTNFPVLYKNSHEMLDPYCLWPLLSQSSGGHSMWLTLVEQVITLLVNNDLKVAWTAASGGQRISLLSALYLPGTFSDIESDVSEVVVETLIALNQPLVVLPITVTQVIRNIQPLRAKLQSREISPSVVRSCLRKVAINQVQNIVVDKVKCSSLLAYVLSDVSSTNCHELLNISLLPVEKAGALPKPFSQQDCIYILADKKCFCFLQEITDQLVWNELRIDVVEQLKVVIGSNLLKMADAKVVCSELIPMSMRKWTNSNGDEVQWIPNANRHPPLQWLLNLWEWLNAALSKDIGKSDILNLSIFPKQCLETSSLPSNINLVPLSHGRSCFLLSSSKQFPPFLPSFVERIGFTVVHETRFVFMQSQIKNEFNPISPESVTEVLGSSTDIRSIASCTDSQPSSDKAEFLKYVSLMNKTSLSITEVNALRQLPLFTPIGNSQTFVALNKAEWILLTEGIKLPILLKYPPNIIHYRSLAEARLLKLLGCHQPSFTELCITHIIPFVLSGSCSNVNNTNVFMKWILGIQMDQALVDHLRSCKFVPRGTSKQLAKPSELYDPEDPKFQSLFNPQDDCIPSSEYSDYFPVLRRLGMQTWNSVSSNVKSLSHLLIERASTVSVLFGHNMKQAFNRSWVIVHLLSLVNPGRELLEILADIPFVFASPRPPEHEYPKKLKWYGEGKPSTYSLRNLYPVHCKLLVGSIGPVLHDCYMQIECQSLFGLLKSLPYISDLFSQLTALTRVSRPSSEMSKIVFLIYDHLRFEEPKTLADNRSNLPPKWIWIEEECKFVSPAQCAVVSTEDNLDLYPYYYTLSNMPQLKNYFQMFLSLGVRKNFTEDIIGQFFSEIRKSSLAYGLDNTQLKVVLHILEWVHHTGKEHIKVLLPTENLQLLPPESCTYNDRYYSDKPMINRGYVFVHPEVPSERAQFFKVVPLGHRLAPSRKLGLNYIKKGPHQSVTSRLKEAIGDYGSDVDVFKELIQNADDAHATEVKFVIDWRQHPCDTLLEPEMKSWQGPALLAYNNAVFTANDFENICKLASGSKKSDPTKIGRFGIGFCSIYHLTDVPSFISSNFFTVFDPHTSYLGNRVSTGKPGMQIDLKEIFSYLDVFRDQFAPYCGMLGFDLTKMKEGYSGTLFRFPFRNDDTASKSEISRMVYDGQRVKMLCNTLNRLASELLIFLQHVKKVSLYEVEANSSVENMKCVLSVTKTLESHSMEGLTLIEQFRQEHVNLQSCQKKLFKVEVLVNQEKYGNHWMVTSCLGSGKSKRLAQSPSGKSDGLCPLAEIGVQLNKTESFVHPKPCDGKLFCFLPLPIQCNLKFYCNGYFSISRDRRWLKKDNTTNQITEWNVALISDALYNCFIKTIVALTELSSLSQISETEKKIFLDSYYSLWPTTESYNNEISRIFFAEFKANICLIDKCILWSDVDGGKWLSPKHVFVYDHSRYISSEIKKEIVSLLLKHHYPIVEIPYDIKSALGELVKAISYKEFSSDVLMSSITTLGSEIRNRQIIALLLYVEKVHDAEWAKQLLRQTPCIPTKPNGQLRRPGDLITPNSPLAPLYTEHDECFPIEAYMETDKVPGVLKSLGMSSYQMTLDKLKERASSVKNLDDEEVAVQRATQVFLYISRVYGNYGYSIGTFRERLHGALQTVPFIPVCKCPQGLSLPWYKSSSSFLCPKDVFGTSQLNLVFANAPVVMKFEDNLSIPIALNILGIGSIKPSIELVAHNLGIIVEFGHQHSLNGTDYELLNNCCPEMYNFLNQALTGKFQNFSPEVDALKNLPFIWQGNQLLFAKQVVITSGIADAYPYLCKLSDENKRYKELFVKLGIPEVLNEGKILSLLETIYCSCDGNLTEEHIRFTVNLAEKLRTLYPRECDSVLYLPNEEGHMQPVDKLAYKEAVNFPHLSDTETLHEHFQAGTSWLHPMFSGDLARSLGIPSALESIVNAMSVNFLDGTDYGQCEDLCDRLNSILRSYPYDVSIFKEFIQNADDAGASEIVFILDHRKFECQDGGLFGTEPEWRSIHECPSLLVYNNRKFSEEDITGITKLGRGSKEFSPEFIGRFGIGFNVAYHVTDCPMFVSYSSGGVPENFCILDPGGLYAPGHSLKKSMRGRRFEFHSPENYQQFSKEFEPFYGDVFTHMSKLCKICLGDIHTGFSNGCVLFRLPFTRSISDYKSKLHDGFKMNSMEMEKLFVQLANNAEDLILFLSNIKSISAFEIMENGTCFHHFTASASLSNNDVSTCRENATLVKQEVELLKEIAKASNNGQSNGANDNILEDVMILNEIYWNYQLEIQAVKHEIDANSHKCALYQTTSLWLISQCFGSNEIPSSTLMAALSRGLIPKGGVAVQLHSSTRKVTPYQLYCSLPLPQKSHMPVHINGSFLVNDSRKQLDVVANQSPLSNWNRCLTQSVVCDAYINALLNSKDFLSKNGTEWYYSKFPQECAQGGMMHLYDLDKMVYCKIIKNNLSILQKDNLADDFSWLPVIGQGCGHFFTVHDDKFSGNDDPLLCERETQLRELLINFGVNLTKAPVAIYSQISKAASKCNVPCNTMISPASFINVLRLLCLQQHKDVIAKNIILLLRYCLSTEEGCDAIKGAPLLLTCDGDVQIVAPTVYGSKYAQLLPHKLNKFIHPKLEQDQGIIKVLFDKEFYMPIPEIRFVGMNSQLINCEAPVNIKECQEYHPQIIEHWKYLDEYIRANQLVAVSCLNEFDRKPIIPSSNRMLVPVCNAKMVLSPEYDGPVKKIMKHFGFPVLDFSILCDMTFDNYTNTLNKILADCRNGDDILKCIELNNLPQLAPLEHDLREDLQHLLYAIATSSYLPSVKSFVYKLPIFDAVTGDLHAITTLHDTYLLSYGIPKAGLKEVMMNSTLLLLESSPKYDLVYRYLGIQCCDIVQFYVNAVIPNFHKMHTEDIIVHVKYLFAQSFDDPTELYDTLEGTRFIYVVAENKFCFVWEFFDPEEKLFKIFFNQKFPPNEWCKSELLTILRQLGLQKDISWEGLLAIVKRIEQEINVEVMEQGIHDKAVAALEFISLKLIKSVPEDGVDEATLQFCKNISKVVFVPIYKNNDIISENFPKKYVTKRWTSFSDGCFAASADVTFLKRNVITNNFDLSCYNYLCKHVEALGITHPPLCSTVIENLLELSKVAQSLVQSSRHQQAPIRVFLQKCFKDHYVYLDKAATQDELLQLKNKECIFVESGLTYSVVSSDCVVKKGQFPSVFPYLCEISDDMLECQNIFAALGISDEPNSCHYANILQKIYLHFITPENKLSGNSKYLDLASEVNNSLIEALLNEEETESVPDDFNPAEVYLLDKHLELCPASQLAYDDVPWYSKRLKDAQTYRYMMKLQGRYGGITLPQSLGVKLLSNLVAEELDDDVQSLDNHCREERIASERDQNHGCTFVLSLESLLQSEQFKLGVLRIIHHQKNTELTEREISLPDKLGNLQLFCYYEIKTNLRDLSNGLIIRGSSDTVFCALIEHTDHDPSLCISPHHEDKDGVVKEIAQNLNRYLGGIIQNESHLEAMIKCPSYLDIESALDKCKVRPYTDAARATVKPRSIGEEICPTIYDLLIVMNYNIGESVKYWSDDGKLVQAKITAVNLQTATEIATKSITISTSDNNDGGKIKTSPILISKFLQPSFFTNWISDKTMTDCTGLLLYHLEHDPVVDLVILLQQIVSSLITVSNHQVSIIFKRLFFQAHFYFVKCNKAPDLFNKISLQYFGAQEQFIASTVGEEECNELAELMEDMCIYTDGGLEDTSDDGGDNDDEVAVGFDNPFANREFSETDLINDDDLNLLYVQRRQTSYFRRPHRRLAANVSGAQTLHNSQSGTAHQTTQPTVTQPPPSGMPTFINAFSQPVIHSTPTHSGLFRTPTGYRSHAHPRRRTPTSVWNQSTPVAGTGAALPLPQTNFITAFVWLKQAIADFNAATHYVECTGIAGQQVNGDNDDNSVGEFSALICFLSHEVVEKCLKAAYLATCGSTLSGQSNIRESLVALYNQLSSSRCWPLVDVKDFVHQVSDHTMKCRYPDSHVPPEAPCVLYTDLDARHALAAAQEIFAKVCSIQCFKDKLPSQPTLLPLLPSMIYLDPDRKCIIFVCMSIYTMVL